MVHLWNLDDSESCAEIGVSKRRPARINRWRINTLTGDAPGWRKTQDFCGCRGSSAIHRPGELHRRAPPARCTPVRHFCTTQRAPRPPARADGNLWRRNSRCDEIAPVSMTRFERCSNPPQPATRRRRRPGQHHRPGPGQQQPGRPDGRPYLKLTQHLTGAGRLRNRPAEPLQPLDPSGRAPRQERERAAGLARVRQADLGPGADRPGGRRQDAPRARAVRELFAEGWAAGFVESDELRRFRTSQNLADWGWGRPTLIVLDYAAIHAEAAERLAPELKGKPGFANGRCACCSWSATPKRAPAGGRRHSVAAASATRAVEQVLDPPEPIALPPLAETAERRAVIAETLEQAESRRAAAGSRRRSLCSIASSGS